MEYGVFRVDKYALLVDMKQATDIKESMDELAEIAKILDCEVEFDSIESVKSQFIVVFIILKFNKKTRHEIALLSTKSDTSKHPLYKGAFLDSKTFERSETRDFFEVMAELYNAMQDIIKEKVRDLDLLIDIALDKKERHWFYELSYKRKRLTSKLNPI